MPQDEKLDIQKDRRCQSFRYWHFVAAIGARKLDWPTDHGIRGFH